MNYHFKIIEDTLERDTIIFAKIDCIFSMNFMTGEIQNIYTFKMPLKSQPQFFKTNDDQSIVIVSSNDDGLYIDMNKDLEVDIDEEY